MAASRIAADAPCARLVRITAQRGSALIFESMTTRSPMVRLPPAKTLRCRAGCGLTTSTRAVSVVKAKPPCSPGVHSRFQIDVAKVGVRVWPPRSVDHSKARPAVSIVHAPSPPPGRRFHHPGFAMESLAERRPRGKPGMSAKANRCGGPEISSQTAPSQPMAETVSTAVVQKRQRLTFGGRTGLIRSWSSPSRTRVGATNNT